MSMILIYFVLKTKQMFWFSFVTLELDLFCLISLETNCFLCVLFFHLKHKRFDAESSLKFYFWNSNIKLLSMIFKSLLIRN